MLLLLLGLILFLGVHSLRLASDAPRGRIVGTIGENGFKIVYSVLSLAGLVLIGQGYGEVRWESPVLWEPPAAARHLALVLVPASFVLVAAAYVPAGYIKARVRHPMILGVALWALAHLLANGRVADVLLFGGFLAWGVADYASSLRRDSPGDPARARPALLGDGLAVGIGLALALWFVAGLHLDLFGVSPLG